MQFKPTAIAGVFEVSIAWHRDERGAFGRTFCADELASIGANPTLTQCNMSSNPRRGTVRGFHLQAEPHAEAKLVQCIAGRMLDVVLDLRQGSVTYGQHHAAELSADSGRMLLIPEGCAHAFQTLEDATNVLYYMSAPFVPESGRGVRWNDPAIGVVWPITDVTISDRDRNLPMLKDLSDGV